MDMSTSVCLAPFFHFARTNKSFQQEVKSLGIFEVCASAFDNEPKKFTSNNGDLEGYLLACTIGKDATKADIKKLTTKVVTTTNRCTNTKSAKKHFETETCRDLTPSGSPVALDAVLLGSDVITVGKFGWSGYTLEELAEEEDFLEDFFTGNEHGRAVLAATPQHNGVGTGSQPAFHLAASL